VEKLVKEFTNVKVSSESKRDVVTFGLNEAVVRVFFKIAIFSLKFLKMSFTKSRDKIFVVPSQMGRT
jgi:hypothetical protein